MWLDQERLRRLTYTLLKATDTWGAIENRRYQLGRELKEEDGRATIDYFIDPSGRKDEREHFRITIERV